MVGKGKRKDKVKKEGKRKENERSEPNRQGSRLRMRGSFFPVSRWESELGRFKLERGPGHVCNSRRRRGRLTSIAKRKTWKQNNRRRRGRVFGWNVGLQPRSNQRGGRSQGVVSKCQVIRVVGLQRPKKTIMVKFPVQTVKQSPSLARVQVPHYVHEVSSAVLMVLTSSSRHQNS